LPCRGLRSRSTSGVSVNRDLGVGWSRWRSGGTLVRPGLAVGSVSHVLDLARGVLAELDLDVVLDRVLRAAQELTGAGYAALGVLDSSATGLERFIFLGVDDVARDAIGALPRGRGVLGELILNPAPLRLDDVSSHLSSYGFPQGHPVMRSFLGVPIMTGGRAYGNLYLTEKQSDGVFTDDDEQAAVVLAEFAGVAVANAQRYHRARRQRDELQETVTALEASTEVAHTAGRQTDLTVVLEMIATRGRALVAARALVIELLEVPDTLVIAAGAGDWNINLRGSRIRLANTVAEVALQTRQVQPIHEEPNRARFTWSGLGGLGVRADSGLAVPLIHDGRPYGAMIAIDRLQDQQRLTDSDARLLAAFAASAARAIATAIAIASERQATLLRCRAGA